MSEEDLNFGVSYLASAPNDKSFDFDSLASLTTQIGGSHYKDCVIQPTVYSYLNNIPAIESSIIRYATRHRNKNKAQDVEKIIHYAKILLQLEYGYSNEQIKEL